MFQPYFWNVIIYFCSLQFESWQWHNMRQNETQENNIQHPYIQQNSV